MELTKIGALCGVLAVLGSAPVAAQDTPIQPAAATHVVCDSGCGSPPAVPDGSTFTAGATNVSLIGAAFNDALAAVTAGTYAAPRITAQRALHVNLRDASGVEFGTLANPFSIQDLFGGHALTDTELRASPPTVAITSAVPIEVTGVGGVGNAVGVAITDSGNAVVGKVKLVDDGGTITGTLKAASTLPALTDTAVVTTQRDPLPAGTNVIGHVVCDSGCAAGAPGQQLMAASSPVVIASNQSAVAVTGTLTAVTAITNALPAGTNVIGHVIVDSSGVLHVIIDSSAALAVTNANLDVALSTRLKAADTLAGVTTVGAVTAITNALPAGTNLLGVVGIDQSGPTSNKVLASQLTSPWVVSGTVTADAGSNLNTSLLAREAGGNLATIAAAVDTPGTTAPTSVVLMGAVDQTGTTNSLMAPQGVLSVSVMPRGNAGLRFPCNALRRTNCQ